MRRIESGNDYFRKEDTVETANIKKYKLGEILFPIIKKKITAARNFYLDETLGNPEYSSLVEKGETFYLSFEGNAQTPAIWIVGE